MARFGTHVRHSVAALARLAVGGNGHHAGRDSITSRYSDLCRLAAPPVHFPLSNRTNYVLHQVAMS